MAIDIAHPGMIQPDVLTVRVRKPVKDDWPFIYNTFIKTAATGQLRLRPDYYKNKRSLAPLHKSLAYRLEILRGREAQFLVACDPDDMDLLMGWACAESTVLHYIFIKAPYRRQGIALGFIAELALGDQQNLAYSVRTMTSEIIAHTHPGRLTYIGFD